jgi:LemA protein
MLKGLRIAVGSTILFLLISVGLCVYKYNEMVGLREHIDGNWDQIENVLQRRNDLIPDLVNTIKGYASREKVIFENVAQARVRLAGATNVSETVKANMLMGNALDNLMAIVVNYPELSADQYFISLREELAEVDNSFSAEREHYNESVRFYNNCVVQFPNSYIADIFGLQPEDIYFDESEET